MVEENDGPSETETDGPPWDGGPDTIITESRIPNMVGRIQLDPVKRLSELHEEAVQVIEAVKSEGKSHEERLLGNYQKCLHHLQSVDVEERDFESAMLYIWREGAIPALQELGEEQEDDEEFLDEMLAELETDDELLDQFAEMTVGKPVERATFDDAIAFLEHNIDVLREEVKSSEIYIMSNEAYDILTFFTAAAGVIEHRSVWLLHEKFISDDYRDTEKTWRFLQENMTQGQREQFLLRTGVISQEVQSKMSVATNTRNRLVHDPHAPHHITDSPENLIYKADRTMGCVRDLSERMDEVVESS